ncbi:rod-binding protein [Amaricoccus sp.]|uniref:rod-binding protein n=1 Tax=Amaricoccus sp. TaxID=1872485 RepID=UPI001B455D84|nr:rod-binding protein [Amaricoccus sp.]MBP7242974.1 rod-binding protein [Amaricoccus sp.]
MDLPPIAPRPAVALDGGAAPSPAPARDAAAARKAAQAFESAFVAEMLKHSGVNRTPEGWGGGAGEDAFGSFLTEEYARLIEARGGLGLAERIFNAMQATRAPGT